MKRIVIITLIAVLSPLTNVRADEPLYQEMKKSLKREYFSVGALLQVVGDYQHTRTMGGNNGFSVANFRMNIGGTIDGGFSYFLQTSFTRSPAILDARMGLKFSHAFAIDAGLFKAPFSKEFLTGAASIDFVNRSQAVAALRPGRQIGVQFRGSDKSGVFRYAAGVFNGNGFSGSNDNNKFMYVGRLTFLPQIGSESRPDDKLEIGVNGAFSEDNTVSLGGVPFAGKRTLGGVDARLTVDKFLLSGEAIFGKLDFAAGPQVKPYGYHATIGYMVTGNVQLLARWDSFRPDGIAPNSDMAVLGFNLWPTALTELQVNYIIPRQTSAFKHHQVLVNTQVAF